VNLLKMNNPYFFEDLEQGVTFEFPQVCITQNMRDKHIVLYGEDWSKGNLDYILKEGIVPSHLIISLIAGQGGASEWMKVILAKSYRCSFFEPIRVGDIIRTLSRIVEKRIHGDLSKNYGYVSVEQNILNQNDNIVYRRDIEYLVERRKIKE